MVRHSGAWQAAPLQTVLWLQAHSAAKYTTLGVHTVCFTVPHSADLFDQSSREVKSDRLWSRDTAYQRQLPRTSYCAALFLIDLSMFFKYFSAPAGIRPNVKGDGSRISPQLGLPQRTVRTCDECKTSHFLRWESCLVCLSFQFLLRGEQQDLPREGLDVLYCH